MNYQLSPDGFKFLGTEEGLRLNAYQDSRGIWTIGLGNTFYEDGTVVKQGDQITNERAMQLFDDISKGFIDSLNNVITSDISQNEFDACFSMAWNIGSGGFAGSALLRIINSDPDSIDIIDGFSAWDMACGQPVLLPRRLREADLYLNGNYDNVNRINSPSNYTPEAFPLRLGMQGTNIVNLQAKAGIKPADGYFGVKTLIVVKYLYKVSQVDQDLLNSLT